jgi:ubiquinone/menaquinone biosynthesis C-methylase UbiE
VLEIGAGSGAMAARALASSSHVTMTVTDFDPAMVRAARERLAPFGTRAACGRADATALPFRDGAFDAVFSFVMLHHTLRWEGALAEAVRVVRPGGHVVGYDLLANAPLRRLHPPDDAEHRVIEAHELRDVLAALPLDRADFRPSRRGFVGRFLLRKVAT